MTTIQPEIPLPARRGGRPRKYPFHTMAVGDSFALPTQGGREENSIRRAACADGKRCGRLFATRALQENGQRVVRVWRLK